jgi:hypothetical protein
MTNPGIQMIDPPQQTVTSVAAFQQQPGADLPIIALKFKI